MKVLDIEAISKLAHSFGNIIVVVDNTFMTSYFQRPLELGADIVAYSISKYMNGHSDVIMGATITNDDQLYERLKFLQNACGIIPSPFDCYQVNRSLKTLALRMERHWKNSIDVAKFLESHSKVDRILYPALPSHPQYALTLKQTYGHSGIMSFYIKGGLNESTKFLQALKVFMIAESLGGFESLAQLPYVDFGFTIFRNSNFNEIQILILSFSFVLFPLDHSWHMLLCQRINVTLWASMTH